MATVAQTSLDWVQQIRDTLSSARSALADPTSEDGIVKDVKNAQDSVSRLIPGSISQRGVTAIRNARSQLQSALSNIDTALAEIPKTN